MVCSFLEELGENPFPCLFQLLERAHIPWHMTLHFQSQRRCISDHSLIGISICLAMAREGSLILRSLVINYIGPTWIIRDNPSISRSLTLITSAKSLSPCKVKYFFLLIEIRMWVSVGGYNSAYHRDLLGIKCHPT